MKNVSIRNILIVFILFLPSTAFGDAWINTFLETFGTGAATSSPYVKGNPTFKYTNPMSHTNTVGGYKIGNTWPQYHSTAFVDHTPGDTNGRLFIGDPARFKRGEIMYNRTINVRPNQANRIGFYAYNIAICSTCIQPQMKMVVKNPSGTVLAIYNTGVLPRTTQWHELKKDVSIGNYTTVSILITSEGYGNVGNDVGIDDIFAKSLYRDPQSYNKTNTVIASTAGPTNIVNLQGTDPDGTVVRFVIKRLPTAAMGVLKLSTGANVSLNQQITPTQANGLRFDPNASFSGNATFTYASKDNDARVDTTPATVTIPVIIPNNPPISYNKTNAVIVSTAGSTDIINLQGADSDGTVVRFVIKRLPTAAMGVLKLSTGANVTLNQQITPTQANGLRFDPNASFSGNATFTYASKDNDGAVDATPATVTIPVNQPPISYNKTNAVIVSTAGSTNIVDLQGTDPDGTVVRFVIKRLPTAAMGVLKLSTGVNVTLNQEITPAQANGLRFDPNVSFSGNATFTYSSKDNDGAVDATPATVTIPVNQPPISYDKTNSVIVSTAGPTDIVNLQGTDPDGTVVRFVIKRLPTAAMGVLKLSTGANVTLNQEITPAQANGLRFDPNASFSGNATFTYSSKDNDGAVDATPATVTIPVIPAYPRFSPSHNGVVLPNNTVFYTHTFISNNNGIVTFTESNFPMGNVWTSIIYQDNDCNGKLSSAEANSPIVNDLATSENTKICLINKVFAPSNVENGESFSNIISANFTFNNSLVEERLLKVTDITKTSIESSTGGSKLNLYKTVENITQATPETSIQNQAKPEDILKYRVYYKNVGTGVVRELKIKDTVPAFTEITGSPICELPLPISLSSCTAIINGSNLTWNFPLGEVLAAGANGVVSFEVKVKK